MIGDLHCHTRISDGSMSVEDIVFYAKRAGLDYLAITDHDSFLGVDRAIAAGKEAGIFIIPGIEISCYDYRRGRRAHILCYAPINRKEIDAICGEIIRSRNESGLKMLDKVVEIYPVTREHVERYSTGSAAIFKPHMMNAIVDLGYCTEMYGDVYKKLFNSENGVCFISPTYPDVKEVLRAVQRSGGIATLAHPRVFDSFDLLEECAEEGLLDAIELHHPSANQFIERLIRSIADPYNLIETGGTDFHGYYTSRPNPIGTRLTDDINLQKLFQKMEEKKKSYKGETI